MQNIVDVNRITVSIEENIRYLSITEQFTVICCISDRLCSNGGTLLQPIAAGDTVILARRLSH